MGAALAANKFIERTRGSGFSRELPRNCDQQCLDADPLSWSGISQVSQQRPSQEPILRTRTGIPGNNVLSGSEAGIFKSCAWRPRRRRNQKFRSGRQNLNVRICSDARSFALAIPIASSAVIAISGSACERQIFLQSESSSSFLRCNLANRIP